MNRDAMQGIVNEVVAYNPSCNKELLWKAFDFASTHYEGKAHFSGEAWMAYALKITKILLVVKPDDQMIVASLFQAITKESEISLELIADLYGDVVAKLVHNYSNLDQIYTYFQKGQEENLRKLFVVIAKDQRVIFMKLAERMYQMQMIASFPEEDRKSLARETFDIYAPIAARLGAYNFKTSLEELSFKFLFPEIYQDIFAQLQQAIARRQDSISGTSLMLQNFLKEHGIMADVQGRVKSVYSIYKKMKKKQYASVDMIFDIWALRIVLFDEKDSEGERFDHLYTTLGLIHSKWTPLANRFKDYVAVPKPNGYRSLHTTVIGLSSDEELPTEIQIRTMRMHEESEFGLAAHWMYDITKSSDYARAQRNRYQGWLEGVVQIPFEFPGESEVEELKQDIFGDRIFVLTPQGDVKDLPVGATPVDFAYALSADIGNCCKGAKVNGQTVPLDFQLKSGQVVSIVLAPKPQSKALWLSFVKTACAKDQLKAWFSEQDVDTNFDHGKELINKFLERLGKPPLDEGLSILKEIEGKTYSLRERYDVVMNVGRGRLKAKTLLRRIFSFDPLLKDYNHLRVPQGIGKKKSRESLVLVDGLDNVTVVFPQCCNAQINDPIVGVVTRGKAVRVHKKGCESIAKIDDHDRSVAVSWATAMPTFEVTIACHAKDRIGLLRDITIVVSGLNVNISNTFTESLGDGTVNQMVVVQVTDFEQLAQVMDSLENVLDVYGVKRVSSDEVKAL